MRIAKYAPFLAAISFVWATSASAQSPQIAYPNEASRELGDCIASSTTGSDRMLAARWMAASMAASPALADIVTVDAAAKNQADRAMGKLFTRLFTRACRDQAKVLMQANDQAGFTASGGRLGMIAMNELMQDPDVSQSLMAYIRFADMQALAQLAQ